MRIRLDPALLAAAWLAIAGRAACAQSVDVLDVDHKLIDYEKQTSALMDNLEYLSDSIGPRLTGSARLRKANEWTAAKMREYGLQNVHLEKWTIPVGWERGACEAQIMEPNGVPVYAAAWAWDPNTHGRVTGPVVYFNPANDDDMKRFEGKLKNAIVLQNAPAVVNEHPSIQPDTGRRRPTGTDETLAGVAAQQQANKRTEFLRQQGASVILIDAGKPQMLLNMTGSWSHPSPIPRLFVAHEDYAMLYRLIERGIQVTMRVRTDNRFRKGPVEVYNTVGEIRGTEKPDEVVICGGHLDSWDLGTGSVDNGTGSMVVLEAARVLQATGVKPKRTIRFILFTGEEEGLFGSAEYVKAHKAEMDRVSAVFVHDTGTGKITGIGLHGNDQVRSVLETELAVLKDLGVTGWSTFLMGGTDHASFYPERVPGFWFMQDSADYGWMHHSQSDTFDKALKDDLVQGATVMAICAYNVAQLPDMLPRRAPK